MVTRTAYPGTATTGTTHTSANDNNLPGGWIGYVESTSLSQTIAAVETDLTGMSVTVTVNTNRRIKVSAYVGGAKLDDASAARANLKIKEGSTVLQQWLGTQGGVNTVSVLSPHMAVILTPSAGSHTYKLAGLRDQGAGNVIFSSSSTNPAWILVEDLGPAS